MELYDFCYYAALAVAPIVILGLFSQDKNFHSKEGVLYLIKRLIGKISIQKAQKKVKVPKTKDEMEKYENPKSIITSKSEAESISFSAVDQEGHQLSVKLTLRADHIVEATLCLRLGTNVYILPYDNGISRKHVPKYQWRCQGLHVEILEPFKRCRLSFNGFLRNVSPNLINHRSTESFNIRLIWNCCSKPNFTLVDDHSSLLAKSLAKTKWRDGNWLNLLGDEKCSVQFGAFKGTVSGTNLKETKLNMTCVKKVTKGTTDTEDLTKCLTIFAATENGHLLHLGVKSLKYGCQNLKFGHVLTHSGSVHPVEKCDLDLEKADRSISEKLTINVEAQSKNFKVVLSINNNSNVEFLNNNFQGYKHRNISAECSINNFRGFALVDQWTSHQGDGVRRPNPILREIKVENLPDIVVTPIGSEESKIVQLTGGKGNSLSLMKCLQNERISVPDGFIVTTQAFRKQIENNFHLRKAVSLLEDIALGKEKGDLKNACEATVELFRDHSITPSVAQKISDELMKFRRSHDDKVIPYLRWAVRSSAVDEDSEESSAAGQNETFLGSQTDKDVLAKICKCWGSLFTYQSVMYRRQHGIPVNTVMAVVVQKMIPSECSGVLFTSHPSTSDYSKMVITSNFGLGETVVSGESEPDTITLKKTYEGGLSLESIVLGSKQHSLIMGRYGIHKHTSDEKSEKRSLSDAQALTLGRVGLVLEEAFGSPRDVEWAFFKDHLYILQSRPVTTLNQMTDDELLHEFDCPHISNDMFYTRANIGEVSPFAVTALTYSSIMNYVEKGTQITSFGKWDPFVSRTIVFSHHFAFIELLACLYARPSKEIKTSNFMVDLAIFGRPVLTEEVNDKAILRYGVQEQSLLDKICGRIKYYRLKMNSGELMVDSHLKQEQQFDIGLTKKDTLFDIYQKIDRVLEQVVKLSLNHNFITGLSIAYQHDVMRLLNQGQGGIEADSFGDLALILSSCTEVISADVPARLERMAAILRERSPVEQFIAVLPEEGVKWLQENCPEVYDLFVQFLDIHGHRLLGELELSLDTWDMDPSIVIRMLQKNCKFATTNKKTTKTPEDIMKELKTPMNNKTRGKLLAAIKGYRLAVGYREQSKSALIRVANKFRKAYRVLAQTMVKHGILPEDNLLYHLTHFEIWQLLHGRGSGLITKAVRRRRLYPTWNKIKFPDLMLEMPRPEADTDYSDISLESIACQGTPVSVGEVRSRAVVITSLDEIDILEKGDVLITKSTDIGWSPYFPILGGIVTEIGGLVSHGAVVAREYGLPCLIGAKDATKMFQTGDIVHLSGTDGFVRLVSR